MIGKAPVRGVQLEGGHAQVQQPAVQPHAGQQRLHVMKIAVNGAKGGIGGKPFRGRGDGGLVPVDAVQYAAVADAL